MPAKLRRGGRSVRGGRRSALRCNVSSRHYTINVQGNVKAACDAGPRAGFVFNDINQLIWYLLGVRIRRPYWPVTVEEYQMPVGAVAITLQRLLSLRRRLPFGPAGGGLTGRSRLTPRARRAACVIFDATGYRRRFRLTLGEKTIEAAHVENTKLPSKRHPVIGPDGQPVLDSSGQPKTKVPEWFFKSSPVAGNVALRITPLHKEFDVALISDLLGFMAKWGALGARAQMGFGVVKITGGETNGDALSEFLTKHKGSHGGQGLPALHQMFFARVACRQPGTLLTAEHTFLLKYAIRRLFSGDDALRHHIMGWVQPKSEHRIGAKIHMSRPYRGNSTLRLWGWVPDLSLQGQERHRERDVLPKIFSYFSSGPFRLESRSEEHTS